MKLTLSVCAAAATFVAASACADTVQLKYTGTGKYRTVTAAGTIFSGNVKAGELLHEAQSGNGEASVLSGTISTFCTELTQSVTTSFKTYTIRTVDQAPRPGGGMGGDKAGLIYDLYNGAAERQYESNDKAAAFQLLIWEIVYDYNGSSLSSIDYSVGALRFTNLGSGVVTWFNTFKALLGQHTVALYLRAATNDTKQDQLIRIPTQVPLPGSIGLGIMGLSVMGLRRRVR
ncbi:MAG: hypothetical protein JNM07_11580 [Phycisphaerae bacterium]|nr:hypothetical protein [Phycisphaerae bacterium]